MAEDNNIDPRIAQLARLATTADIRQQGPNNDGGGSTPSRMELASSIQRRVQTRRKVEKMFKMLPELGTICTIATCSILSTKDLVTTTLIYDSNPEELSYDAKHKLSEVIRDYFDTKNKLPKKLYKWVYEAMSTKGASPVLIIPAADIEQMFDIAVPNKDDTAVAQESIKKTAENIFQDQQGYIFNIKKDGALSLESLIGNNRPGKPQLISESVNIRIPGAEDDIVSEASKACGDLKLDLVFTDNANVVYAQEAITSALNKTNKTKRGLRKSVVRESSYKGVDHTKSRLDPGETGNQSQDAPMGQRLYENERNDLKAINPDADKKVDFVRYIDVQRSGNRSDIPPLDRTLPAEAITNIFLPGEEDQPIAHIVMLDELGNPLSSRSTGYNNQYIFGLINNQGLSNEIVDQTALGMGQDQMEGLVVQKLLNRFGEVATSRMLDYMKNAMGGGEISMDLSQDWLRVMFTRALAKRQTQILFVPAENMSYFAIDYNEDGIGVSLTERSMVLNTIRVAIQFAMFNGVILNSTRNMLYEIDLPENERDGAKAVARVKADILQNQNNMPSIWGDPEDTFNHASSAGTVFSINGNDWYSSLKVTANDITPDYKIPDSDFDEQLIRRTSSMGRVDPDLVLTPDGIEFASQIFSKSLIVTQQILSIQEALSVPITNYVQTYSYSYGPLLDKMADELTELYPREEQEDYEEYKDRIISLVNDFLDNLQVTLPPPDTSAGESQMEQFDKRSEFFEKLAEAAIDDATVDALQAANLPMDGQTIRDMVRNYYMRTWLKKNDIEGDFFDIFDPDKRQDMVKAISDEVKENAMFIGQLSKRVSKKVESAIPPDEEESDGFGSDESGFGGSDDMGSDESDDLSGEDDLEGLGGDDNEEDDLDLSGDTDLEEENDGNGPTSEDEEAEAPEEDEDLEV